MRTALQLVASALFRPAGTFDYRKMLRRGLDGYDDSARTVRYPLIPGVW